MRKIKFRDISIRELFTIIIPALLVVLAVFLIAYYVVQPAPPGTIVMTTGIEGRTYAVFGERYKEILARSNVHLELLNSSGSVENFKRLKDKAIAVDVGFVQGGASSGTDAPNLLSLGSITYSPLWVFYTGKETLDDFSQLKGKRIAIGPEGSGLRKLSLDLLKAGNAADLPTILLDIADGAAIKALKEGQIDVVITIGSTDTLFMQELLNAHNVKLMNSGQAEAYTRLVPGLSHVILPKGIINIAKRLPPSGINLVAPTTNLVVRNTLHPALMYLLLDAASEIHGGAGWVNKAGEFPAPKVQDFPLSDQAERFYKTGRPFLLDYLPFWVAVLLDRIVKILIPVLVVIFPLMKILPWFYSWRNRSKLYRLYGELKYLELEITQQLQPEHVVDYYARLDRIEAAANKVSIPLNFYGELYTLKEHIELVRKKVIRSGELVKLPEDLTDRM
ncbi:MAG: C4-dicarboxylate ABC transporter substrate-binding protein [Proteobacteria bacterium]|nr:C4-dicarboxylate ABC transporter substrate-binding protein [Pseudomonadota bacterium]